jgi:hypothetical protein
MIVGHGGKGVIRGEDEGATYWFVGYGIYDYATDAIGGVSVSCILGCKLGESAKEKCYGQGDRCKETATRNGWVSPDGFF